MAKAPVTIDNAVAVLLKQWNANIGSNGFLPIRASACPAAIQNHQVVAFGATAPEAALRALHAAGITEWEEE